VPWVAGLEWVARAGTCRGSARGPNAGWKMPKQRCMERRVRVLRAFTRNSWLGDLCRGNERHCAHSSDRGSHTKRARTEASELTKRTPTRSERAALNVYQGTWDKRNTRAHGYERYGTHQTVSAVSFVVVPHVAVSHHTSTNSRVCRLKGRLRQPRTGAPFEIRLACVLGDRTTKVCIRPESRRATFAFDSEVISHLSTLCQCDVSLGVLMYEAAI
jgi:hypothetical protein